MAIVWAVVFAATSDSLTTDVPFGVAVLLVLYPLIDVGASLTDARGQTGSARQILLGGAATSAIAAVALGIAATGTVGDAVAVFGVWAFVSGAAQLAVALRRRAQFGLQLPMLLAGGFSVVFGVALVIMSTSADPILEMVAIYAATGGIDFIVEAALLARRRRRSRLATVPA